VTVKIKNFIGEIRLDYKLRGKIDISFGCYLEEIVREILLT